ncbi:glutamine-hydrolyzing GMP synthase [Candidatus Micrarchaeota archaeon]|nr:glutamine-hydrolyzing GMP synthase [Candidatus Micrarchaeota archaeon]
MIIIIDNGSQYTHLIKRTIRELDIKVEIISNTISFKEIKEKNPCAIILSGGPSSVFKDENSLGSRIIKEVYKGWNIPLLGICYGHQLIAHVLGGKVGKGPSAEYGLGKVFIDEEDLLFKGIKGELQVWTSHFDEVKGLPEGFVSLAHSEKCPVEAMKHKEKNIFGVQFHPEVWHTEHGEEMYKNFVSLVK